MGLFGGSSKSTSNNYNTTNTTETNQQSGLLNLSKDANVNGAINISNGVTESNEEMRKAAEAAFGFGDNALELGGKVVDSNASLAKNAIENSTDLAGKTVGFASSAIEDSLDFSKSLVDQNTANSANSTLAIKDLANSMATGGASDVAAQSTKMVYTLGAVVAVVVLGFGIMVWGRK